MKFKAIIFLIILVLVSSCGEYGKVLKSTDYDLKKEKAKEYYNKGEYVRQPNFSPRLSQGSGQLKNQKS